MKMTVAILLASTALAVGAGIPAWSAMQRVEHSPKSFQDNPFVRLAGDDDDGDRESGRSYRSNDDDHRDGDDDDDDDDGGGDDDEDDDGSLGAGSASPAPAGTVAPPANGLFGSGAMPKVKVN
jgi:hypothetical protein